MVCIDDSLYQLEVGAGLNLLFYVLFFLKHRASILRPLLALNFGFIAFGLMARIYQPSSLIVSISFQLAFAVLVTAVVKALIEVSEGTLVLLAIGPVWLSSRMFMLNWLQQTMSITVSEVAVAIFSLILVAFVALIYVYVRHIKFFAHVLICFMAAGLLTISFHEIFIQAPRFSTTVMCCPSDDTCFLALGVEYIVLLALLFILQLILVRLNYKLTQAALRKKIIDEDAEEKKKLLNAHKRIVIHPKINSYKHHSHTNCSHTLEVPICLPSLAR